MRSSNLIPLTRESNLRPFLMVAKEIGAPVNKLLARSGLPSHLDGNGAHLILIPQIMHFLKSVADIEGVTNYGLLAGNKVPYPDLPGMQSNLMGFANLQDLLYRFIYNGSRLSANAQYRIQRRKEHIHFIHIGRRYIEEDVQAQLHQVLGMIQIVRLIAGKNWVPDNVGFSFKPRREVEQAIEFSPARIHFTQVHAGITIPLRLFSLSAPELEHGTASLPLNYTDIPNSFSDSLYELILSYSLESKVDKTRAADILNLSPRTLQRRLAAEGTSYLQIHNRARLDKATQLFGSTDIKLLDIALSLGYENASSFTRAFQLWTGITPREYRKKLCELPH